MACIDRTLVQKCLDDLSSENLIGNENDTFISLAEAKDRIEELPTADVVPRAEYEKVVINMNAYGLTAKRLQEDIERLQELNNRQVEDIRLAKTEVAREIFEEIEQSLYMHFRFCKEESGNVDPKYLEGRLALNTQMQDLIAELKNKYTEAKDEGYNGTNGY